MKVSSIVLWAGICAVIGTGCAGQAGLAHAEEPTSSSASQAYAAALHDAFDSYERDIERALRITYSSDEEAIAVHNSLGPAHFDWLLESALAARGLTLADLGDYARRDAAFFHAQQEMYWGRLDRLQQALLSVRDHVRAPAVDQFSSLEVGDGTQVTQ